MPRSRSRLRHTKLQLALDRVEDFAILREVGALFDYIEVGTGLLKRCGIGAISTVREMVSGPQIVADSKTADGAFREATMLFSAGADLITVLSSAHSSTIDAAVECAEQMGKGLILDSILEEGVAPDRLDTLPPPVLYLAVHTPTDARLAGHRAPGDAVAALGRFAGHADRVMLAGGLGIEQIIAARELGVGAAVIGRAVTYASDPLSVARRLFEAIESRPSDPDSVSELS